jgi:hypothetical protein
VVRTVDGENREGASEHRCACGVAAALGAQEPVGATERVKGEPHLTLHAAGVEQDDGGEAEGRGAEEARGSRQPERSQQVKTRRRRRAGRRNHWRAAPGAFVAGEEDAEEERQRPADGETRPGGRCACRSARRCERWSQYAARLAPVVAVVDVGDGEEELFEPGEQCASRTVRQAAGGRAWTISEPDAASPGRDAVAYIARPAARGDCDNRLRRQDRHGGERGGTTTATVVAAPLMIAATAMVAKKRSARSDRVAARGAST